MKKCSKCKEIKHRIDFRKNKSRGDGVTCYCKICIREYYREYREKNSEKIKRYYEKYKKEGRRKDYTKKYYKRIKDTDKHKEYQRNYRKKYHKTDKWKKIRNISLRKRRKKDTMFRLNSNISREIWGCLSNGKGGRRWEELVGYELKDLIKHLESKFEPWMTWESWGKINKNKRTWNIDHIRPISSFKFSSPEDPEFKKCWALENLQPLDAMENIKKGNNEQ